MNGHSLRKFDEELGQLKKYLLEMAAFAEECIREATQNLKTMDPEKANILIANDTVIDELENKIDEKAIEILALQQPMAKDLRFITMGMKVNSELERIADLTVNISQCIIRLSKSQYPRLEPRIFELGTMAQQMVKEAIDAFVSGNETLARQVILKDAAADGLRHAIEDVLVQGLGQKNVNLIVGSLQGILIAKNYERICDHATYIAEDVVYMTEADIIRHHPEKL